MNPSSIDFQPERPGPGQESVWDYPRPPRIETTTKHVQVVFNGIVIAETRRAKRVLETSHPPVYYVPSEDVRTEYLVGSTRRTWCEWKGEAAYFNIATPGAASANAAWSYANPHSAFATIGGHFAFYPSRVEACYVEGERVRSQDGDFYGGWITDDIAGPFKGAPGTLFW